ncbi:MAG: SDR family oxidoreductase, partial [Bacteroidales bacterium]|nr:SDR family oxidoreductase [Bacteroidales bacterium]
MFKENILKGKTIIVTGGGTGLGKSMATKFSELGANIVITSRKAEVIEKTASEISEKTGNPVLAVQADVRKPFQNEAVLEQAIAKFGQVDGLLNNAAGNFISPTERLSYKAFDTIVDIVLKGTYNFTLAIGKYWIENNIPGTVLNIVTTYASVGSGFVVPSAIAKAGVLNLTRSLATEWGKYNIRLNAIAPGPFPTKGAWDRLFPGAGFEEKLINKIPLKRVGEHSELANLATYLM